MARFWGMSLEDVGKLKLWQYNALRDRAIELITREGNAQ